MDEGWKRSIWEILFTAIVCIITKDYYLITIPSTAITVFLVELWVRGGDYVNNIYSKNIELRIISFAPQGPKSSHTECRIQYVIEVTDIERKIRAIKKVTPTILCLSDIKDSPKITPSSMKRSAKKDIYHHPIFTYTFSLSHNNRFSACYQVIKFVFFLELN